MKTTIQHDQRDCGAACLHMIARHYGFSQPITKFRELTKTDKNGASVYGLIDAAKAIGLKARAMSGTVEELIGEVEQGNVKFPFVAHTITEYNIQHFVVISGYKSGCFLVNDPSKGKIKIRTDEFSKIWTGYIVTFELTDDFKKQKAPSSGLFRFFKLLMGQHRKVALAIILSVVISIIGIAGAFVFHTVIDNCPEIQKSNIELSDEECGDHVHNETEHDYIDDSLSIFGDIDQYSLTVIFTALICMYLFASVIQYIRGRLIITISKNIDLNLTLPYFFRIIDMPVSSVEQRQTGDYLSRFSDAVKIRDAISTATLALVLDALMAIGCGVILFLQNRTLFLISFIVIAVYALVVMFYRRSLSNANRDYMEANAIVQSYLKESVDGIATVKAATAEDTVKNNFSTKFNKFIDAIVKKSRIGTSLDTIVTAVQSIGVAVILWFGFSMVLKGSLPLGSLITFYALLGYFIEPVKNLISLQPTMQTASIAAERLTDILDASVESDITGKEDLPSIREWKAENVSFRYGNGELTLENVSLSVKSGERVAIVGESGCGKTTLAKLFLRFGDPENGAISADGKSLTEFMPAGIRKNIAYVDQNTFLFSGTIRENLLIGNSDAGEETLIDVCTSAGIYTFIQKLPFGFDTIIEENGANLSGGQKQRIAIARALLKKPKLLILDEATSNLDTVTEAAVKETICSLTPEMACIIIAHRLSTIKNCDRIYVMHEGHIVESGTHDDLTALDGKYAELLRNQ